MAIEITVPRLGWNMEEGVFGGWLKLDGEQVAPGEALFCLESDKATQDVECLDGGVLRIPPNGPKQGDKVAVGIVIGYLVQPGETLPINHEERNLPSISVAGPLGNADSPPASSSAQQLGRGLGQGFKLASGAAPGGRVTVVEVQRLSQERAEAGPRLSEAEAAPRQSELLQQPSLKLTPTISPRAKRVAGELGMDWTRVQGSGRTGRIRERDVRAAAAKVPIKADTASADRQSAIISQPFEPIPITPIRQAIAERLLASVRTTVPVTLTTTVDATHLVNLRNQFKTVAAAGDALIPTFIDFLVKLAAIALRDHPLLNARWGDKQILVASGIHIGIAVDTDAGLLVPVIRDVSSLSLKQVAARSRDLIARARQRKLQAEEMQGGTFTISNLGAFGIDAFTPVINYPECAILGMGRIQRQPVVAGERIVSSERLTLNLTFDHRIVDGVPAARFLQALGSLIENPSPPLMS
jgi:pyruvate dehydrogenase E2 component (dihydrolipoamide acetyltransferase)